MHGQTAKVHFDGMQSGNATVTVTMIVASFSHIIQVRKMPNDKIK